MAQTAFAVHTHFQSPFLEGLAPAELNNVLSAASERRFPAKTVICTQGMPADRVYLIVKGRARFFTLTRDGNKILVFWLSEGELLGGATLQRLPSNYILSSETITESTMLMWERPAIRRLVVRYPRLLDNALIAAAKYLSLYAATHIALTSHSAPERLAAVLLNLAQGIGHAGPRGIELDVSNEELAQAANVSHFTASRQISEWQKQGALEKMRGKVFLRFPEKLFPGTT